MTSAHNLEQLRNVSTDSLFDRSQKEIQKAATLVRIILSQIEIVLQLQQKQQAVLKIKIRHQVLSNDKIWLTNCDETWMKTTNNRTIIQEYRIHKTMSDPIEATKRTT